MCGIAGFTHTGGSFLPERIYQAVSSISHRGPDQQGIWQNEAVSLGATRLKVIDTGAAPTNPFLGADVVRAECTAQAGPAGTGTTTGKTTIAGATLGGSDICAGLGLAPTAACPNPAICCEPPPNTDVCAALGLTPQ